MKHRSLFGLMVGLVLLTSAASAQQDTVRVDLQEAWARALHLSPDLEAARAKARFAEARSDAARASRYFTELTLESAFAMVPGLTNPNGVPLNQLYLDPAVRNDYASLSPYAQSALALLQPIHTFGALRGRVRAAAYGADAEHDAVATVGQDVVLRTADLYYGVLLADALLALTGQATTVVAQAMREIDRLLAEGDPDVDDADRYQVLITEQELHRRIREVKETQAIAHAGFSRQLLMDEGTVAIPSEAVLQPLDFIPLPLAEYKARAVRHRPELKRVQAGLHAQSWLVRAARADYYPQIVFGFSFTITGAANRHRQPNPFISDGFRRSSARTGIGFRQKLNFAQTKARIAQAEARRDEMQHLVTAAEQVVLIDVEKAYRELSMAEAALAAQDSSLAISKEWLRVETINFDLELGSTENLIDAVQANLDLEARYLEAVRRFNMAVHRLQHAAGILGRMALVE